MNYRIEADTDELDETPVDVQTYYDRSERSWVTYLVNAAGEQIGDADYNGTKAAAAASERCLRATIG